jgi:hypothetical protein
MDCIKSEDELLQGIIDKQGDCISPTWCGNCPFIDNCLVRAITYGKLLPKEVRVRMAYEKLFNKLMENELGN